MRVEAYRRSTGTWHTAKILPVEEQYVHAGYTLVELDPPLVFSSGTLSKMVVSTIDGIRPLQRPTWDDTCMEMLPPLEDRATCFKHRVACILFDPVEKDIIKVGYNGAPHGKLHCDVAEPIMDGLHHINCIHAECNGLMKAGTRAEGAWLYCSLTPCRRCAILCVQGKISRFIYRDTYNIAGNTDMDFVIPYFASAGIELVQWKKI